MLRAARSLSIGPIRSYPAFPFIDRFSVAADPLFVDWRAGNFSLRPGSPALRLGFTPIDQSRIGLLKGILPGPGGLHQESKVR